MNIETTMGVIMGLAAIVATIVQILKATPIPTEKPKLVAFIVAFIAVGITAVAGDKFTAQNAPEIATGIGAVSVSAYGLYEVGKTAYKAILKLIDRIKDRIKK